MSRQFSILETSIESGCHTRMPGASPEYTDAGASKYYIHEDPNEVRNADRCALGQVLNSQVGVDHRSSRRPQQCRGRPREPCGSLKCPR